LDIIDILEILIAFSVPLITVISVFISKKLVMEINVVNQSIYQLIFRIPFLIFAAIITWKYTDKLIPYIVVFGILDMITTVIYFWALKILDTTTFQLIGMSNIIITLFLGAIIGFEVIESKVILGIIIFVIAVYMVTNIKITDIKGLSSNIEIIAIILKFVEIIIKAIKMFIIKELIVSGTGSNETIILLSTLIEFTLLLIVFRPKLDFKEIDSKAYIIQGLLTMLANAAMGYSMVAIGVVTLNTVRTSSVIMIALVYAIIDKKLPTLKKNAGILLGTIGLIIIMS